MPSRLLPLFPLPLVLFPSAIVPLHVFEPRYRELLADVRRADGRFGIVLATGGSERALPRGLVGCVAEVQEVHALPDGRSNVLVAGIERFAVDALVDAPAAYHVAAVTPYDDVAEDDDAAERGALDARVRALFERVARAARAIRDETAPLPPLPDDPALVSFRVASLVDLDNAARQALLTSRSAVERLREIDALLESVVDTLEERATVHGRARTNGHGPTGDDGDVPGEG